MDIFLTNRQTTMMIYFSINTLFLCTFKLAIECVSLFIDSGFFLEYIDRSALYFHCVIQASVLDARHIKGKDHTYSAFALQDLRKHVLFRKFTSDFIHSTSVSIIHILLLMQAGHHSQLYGDQ